MNKITVVNPQTMGNILTKQTNSEQQRTFSKCCWQGNKKILFIILLIIIISIIIIGSLIPTVILKKDKNQLSSSTKPPMVTTAVSPAKTATTKKQGVKIPMDAVGRNITGVYNTTVGGNSMQATAHKPNATKFGKYLPGEAPQEACDGNTSTKYLSVGNCYQGDANGLCGLNTGFYLELQQGPTLVNGLRICTGVDSRGRDPSKVSLEGSNQSDMNLTLGSNWALLYKGNSGLDKDPGRMKCGSVLNFNNTIEYKSYRFLVSDKYAISDAIQYSEVEFYKF